MRVLLVIGAASLAAALAPATAAAQGRKAFATGVVELTRALEGTDGDGTAVTAALESMARALAAWDRDLRRREAQMPAAIDGAPAQVMAEMHTALGWAYLERGRSADALLEFERAIQVEPRQPAPHLLQGLVHLADEPAQAVPAFRRAWALDRSDPIPAYWLVQSALQAGRTDRAEGALDTLSAAYRRLARQDRSARALPFPSRSLFQDGATDAPIFPPVAYHDGFTLIARGEYDRALTSLREAAATDPLVVDSALRSEPMRRGIAAREQGRTAAALVDFERALELTPRSSEVRRVLGIAYRAAGRFEEGIASLEAAIRLNPFDERARLALVSALRQDGSLPQAERALQEAIATFPTSGALRWTYAMLYHQARREEEMLQQLEAVPTSGILAGRGHVFAAIGSLHLAGKRMAAAERPFQLSVLAGPNNPAAHMHLGELYRLQGLRGPALATFVAALLIVPDVVEAHTAIGQIHLAAGEFDDAVIAFRTAVALQPEHGDAHYGLARALLRRGQDSEATAHFETFRRLQRERIATRRRMYAVASLQREAALHEDAGRHGEAVAIWRTIVEREPARAEHHLALGEALVRAGRLDRAIVHLERAAASTDAAEVYRRLGELYAALGRGEASVAAHAEYQRRQAEASTGP